MTPREKRLWNEAKANAQKEYNSCKARYERWIAAGNAPDGVASRQLYNRMEKALQTLNRLLGRSK